MRGHVFVWKCIGVFAWVCLCVCVRVFLYVFMCLRESGYAGAYVCVWVCVCMCVCGCVSVVLYVCENSFAPGSVNELCTYRFLIYLSAILDAGRRDQIHPFPC